MMRGMMTLVDQNAVAADWRRRGFSCGLWVDPRGQVWADFVHDTDEIVMVLEGDVEFEIAGMIHRPRAAEELLIPAGASGILSPSLPERESLDEQVHWLPAAACSR